MLVYAADDDEVLADFALPYYSYFDISTLEREDVTPDPPRIEDPLPTKPPYVLEVPQWTLINQSPVFTLQGTRVQHQVTQVRADLTTGLNTFFLGVNYGQGAGGGAPPTGGTTQPVPGGGFGAGGLVLEGGMHGGLGLFGNPLVTDPEQIFILQRTNALRNERNAIQVRMDRGIDLTSDQQRTDAIDQELGELLVQGSRLPGLQGDDASLSAGDRAFVESLGATAVTIQNTEARTAVADRMVEINTAQPNTLLIGNLGNLAGVLQP